MFSFGELHENFGLEDSKYTNEKYIEIHKRTSIFSVSLG
jgi:hypothetical protein